jgi:hypothetical protein
MKLKHVKKSEKFGFWAWNLDAKEKFQKLIDEIIKEGVEVATTEYEVMAHFPHEWKFMNSDGIGNKNKKYDPLDIYVGLPLGESEDALPTWSFNLRDMVRDAISGFECGQGGHLGEGGIVSLGPIRDGLKALVSELDEALARKVKDASHG